MKYIESKHAHLCKFLCVFAVVAVYILISDDFLKTVCERKKLNFLTPDS